MVDVEGWNQPSQEVGNAPILCMQQSQSIISMGLLGSSLTLLLWPYVSWRFSKGCDGSLCFSNSR